MSVPLEVVQPLRRQSSNFPTSRVGSTRPSLDAKRSPALQAPTSSAAGATPTGSLPFNYVSHGALLTAMERVRAGGLGRLSVTTVQLVGPLRMSACQYADDSFEYAPAIDSTVPPEATSVTIRYVGAKGEPIADPAAGVQAEDVYGGELAPPRFRIATYEIGRTELGRFLGLPQRDLTALVARETGFIEPRHFARLVLIAQDAFNAILAPDAVHIVAMSGVSLTGSDAASHFVEVFPILYTEVHLERIRMMLGARLPLADDVSGQQSVVGSIVDPAAIGTVLPPDFELIALEVYLTFALSDLSARVANLTAGSERVLEAVLHHQTKENLLQLEALRRSMDATSGDAAVLRTTIRDALASTSNDLVFLSFQNCEGFIKRMREDDEAAPDGSPAVPRPASRLLRANFPRDTIVRSHNAQSVLSELIAPGVPSPPASSSTAGGAEPWPVSPAAIADLLESTVFSVEGVVVEVQEMAARANGVENAVALMLDCARNALAFGDYILSMVGTALAFGAVVTGMFGMNLHSGLEEYQYYVFWAVAVLVVISGSVIVALIWRNARKSGIMSMLPRLQQVKSLHQIRSAEI